MDMRVDKGLVPLGLAGLLHGFGPSLALVTVFTDAGTDSSAKITPLQSHLFCVVV